MSRISFKTGKRHQERATIWARRRLADRNADARKFSRDDDQDGVLFADGVGMGKTWEALGAAALILFKRVQRQRDRGHVLILCPANLVTKWEDELAAGSPFRKKLDAWEKNQRGSGKATVAKCVHKTLTHVLPIRSTKHVRPKLKRGKFHPPGGTYIISQSLFNRRGAGLNALRREAWDVVIVDEAHNAAARCALDKLHERRRCDTKLLLTATPFQLDPGQLHSLAKHLLKHGQKVLRHPTVARYIEQLAEVFAAPHECAGPRPHDVDAVGEILRLLAARTVLRNSNRRYELLLLDGKTKPLPARLDELDDARVREVLADLRAQNDGVGDPAFERIYFEERLRIATRKDQTYVATQLRRFLSTGTKSQPSPRQRALSRWAEAAFQTDIRAALTSGLPHKTIVFTAWVGTGRNGEAAQLQRVLARAFAKALAVVKRSHPKWNEWVKCGRQRLANAGDALSALTGDELTASLAGKHSHFVTRMRRVMETHDAAIKEVQTELRSIADHRSIETRAFKRRIADMKRTLSVWGGPRSLDSVERYTGSERRSARDRAAMAFREIGPPWVLVASNIGSEGIDLHTYTARIVHYDLEWNPAKMEQREGRGDRVGRRLRDKLTVMYCLVPRTYDERMFHQLVARDRWHGVLLGKPASKLLGPDGDAPVLDRDRIQQMRLDLAPRPR